MKEKKSVKELFGNPVSVYTSDQAEGDGLLIKIKDDDINYMTKSVYSECIDKFLIKDDDGNVLDGFPTALNLMYKLISSVKAEVVKIQEEKGLDWFYNIKARGWEFYVCQNETGKYTLMFPEDY